MTKYVLRETDIVEIARFLGSGQNQKPVLFIGRRGGGLFNNITLYNIVKNFTLRPFDMLPEIDKFTECYTILYKRSRDKRFSEVEIRQILNSSLSLTRYREEDKFLATLIKEGLFETIITTNGDAMLEEACLDAGMKNPYDYKVIIHGIDDSKTIVQGKTSYRQVIKVFGDFNLPPLHTDTGNTRFDLEADQVLKEFLHIKLAEEVLMIGYDPIWDQPIERAFLEAGNTIWFVNEELPPDSTHLAQVLRQRDGRQFIGPQGSYKSFLTALRSSIGKSEPHSTQIHVSIPPSHEYTRNKAFVSYSHKDSKYLERLQVHIKGYRYVYGATANLDVWDDRKIQKGANWQEEIKKAIDSAKVAVLLVSPDFLASDFIHDHEFPALIEAAKQKKLTILAIVVGPCPFDRTPLFLYQAINKDLKPLTKLSKKDQEEIWADVADKVCSILNTQN